ncbi:type I-U CRISPR-associated protein Cas5/Cas6 [Planctomycetales bacterium]|nr:type I-U CRISPR-associated protein Cas5/Cas6 [Planctomycetales bacterium]
MNAQLCISIRFLDGAFHGRVADDENEYPPSPLRLFQALVAAAGAGGAGGTIAASSAAALHWLEQLPAPEIFAAPRHAIQPKGYWTYVPNNQGDLVAKQWAGHKTDATFTDRVKKFIRPTLLAGAAPAENAVHYLWTVGADAEKEFAALRENLFAIVRAVSRLGWGVDLVVAEAQWRDSQMPLPTGEHYLPTTKSGGAMLRVPIAGSLADLQQRHEKFLHRLDGGIFRPVPPLKRFDRVTYRRENEIALPPFAIFALRRPDDSALAAFSPTRRGLSLIGMLRHCANRDEVRRIMDWSAEDAAAFVLGHGEAPGETHQPVNGARLVFLPLPSLEWRGAKRGAVVGAFRRVLVTVKGEYDDAKFARLINALDGAELIDEKTQTPTAFLRRENSRSTVVERYLQASAEWATVTPVILPGYDDPRKLRRRLHPPPAAAPLTADAKNEIWRQLDRRLEHLLRKALRQSGIPDELAQTAQLDWRDAGFLPGVDLAKNYDVPHQHRRYRRVHLRIDWRDAQGEPLKISGPLCVGGGKFSGLGLLATMPDSAGGDR